MTINYTTAITSAAAEHKALSYKSFVPYCTGENVDSKTTRAAFQSYRDDAAALIMAVCDYNADVCENKAPDAAALLTAARAFLDRFAPDAATLPALLFNVADGERNADAAARIATALAPIAKNGTAKQMDGTRRGAINLNADGKTTTIVMAALEQWTLDRINGAKAPRTADYLADKKAKKAAAAARRAAKAAAAENAKQPAPVKADAKPAKKPGAKASKASKSAA